MWSSSMWLDTERRHTTHLDVQIVKETMLFSARAQEANKHDDQLCDISHRSCGDVVPPLKFVFQSAAS